MSLEAIQGDIARYYTRKIEAHGPTPPGVDWVSEPTQFLRFVQLLKICDLSAPFSLNDAGCGYGALRGFLDQRVPGIRVDYLGCDLSGAMIAQARAMWAGRDDVRFRLGSELPRIADYTVASGIFNVKLEHADADWEALVVATLQAMWRASRKGLAVNFLAPLEADVHGAPQLYRCDAATWRDYCEVELGAQVEVVTGYGMREYTLLVTPSRGSR